MNKKTLILLGFILLKFLLQTILISPDYDLQRDEYLHIDQRQHLAWGYQSVPPFTSWVSYLIHLLGNSIFWVKFFPALFGALTILIVWKAIETLNGNLYALVLGATCILFSAVLRINTLYQPNSFDILSWTAFYYFVLKYFKTENVKWLYVAAMVFAFGFLNKYNMLFLVVGLLPAVLLTEHRKVFAKKQLYVALLLALVIVLPNLIWQYKQHFPFVFHMEKLQRTQLQYISPASFLIDQLIMNLPCVFIWLTGLWAIFFVKELKNYRFIGWAYLCVIGLLLLGHGKNYYALGAYPVLFAFGAYQLEQLTALRFTKIRYVLFSIPVLLGYWLIPIALPVMEPAPLAGFYEKKNVKKLGVLNWEDGKSHPLPQDFADMLGWEEMAQKMAKAYNSLDSNEKKNTLLFCDNYGQAGAINYYRKKYHLPEAFSDNASFLYWMPDSLHFDNILLLTDDEKEMEHPFLKNFSSVILSDSITNNYAREKGDLILLLKGMNETMRQAFKEKIRKAKAEVAPLP